MQGAAGCHGACVHSSAPPTAAWGLSAGKPGPEQLCRREHGGGGDSRSGEWTEGQRSEAGGPQRLAAPSHRGTVVRRAPRLRQREPRGGATCK